MKFITAAAAFAMGVFANESFSTDNFALELMNAFGESLGPLENCGTASDLFQFDDLSIAPYPIISGQPVTVSLRGKLEKALNQGAKVNVIAKLGFVKVYDETIDVCDGLKQVQKTCPLPSGDTTIQTTQNVPGVIPKATVNVEVRVLNADGAQAACLKGKVKII